MEPDFYMFIKGKKYITVEQFAQFTNRSEETVRKLMHKGNRLRKLKKILIGHSSFIPLSEVTDFPFTFIGPSTSRIYKYRFNREKNVYEPYIYDSDI